MTVSNRFSIVLLTFNSEASIRRTLSALEGLSDDIHVVDSFSTDSTVAICESLGCKVVQHPFEHYSAQRNWAIDNLTLLHPWQLHIDADEEMEPALADELGQIDLGATTNGAFMFGRKIVFMGKVLRFGAINKTWHLRLFRTGAARCEDRLYDQHFVSSGPVAKLSGCLLDHQEDPLAEWTRRHNRWSDLEAEELSSGSTGAAGRLAGRATGNAMERKRFAKQRYYRLPLFWRALAYFLYRYVLRLGFLDGTRGAIYHVLQGFWFRFLVDAKLYERRRRQRQ